MEFFVGDLVKFKDRCSYEDIIPSSYNTSFNGVVNGKNIFKYNEAIVIGYYYYNDVKYYKCEYIDYTGERTVLGFTGDVLKLRSSEYVFKVGDEVSFVDNIGNLLRNNVSGYYNVPDEFYSANRGIYAGKGTASFKTNKGIIKKIRNHDSHIYIVEYLNVDNIPTPLAFKKENLKLITKSNTNVTNKTESSSNGIKVQRPHPSVTGVTRRGTVSVSGRTSRTAVTVGHLSHKTVSF